MAAGRFDLHVHTSASDGAWPPARVVEEAAREGLDGIAITDHDTVAGLEEALAAGRKMGVRVLPGVELGSEQDSREVHVLGYFIDPGDARLRETLAWLEDERRRRLERMLERLAALGVPVARGRVLELACGVPGRPHVARAMVEAGWVASVEEAFDRFLESGRPGYVPRAHLAPAEAARLVHQAGGCAVLAHPGLLDDDAMVERLLESGLDGIEAYYPGHSPEQTARYESLGRGRGLVVTGGTDFHGLGLGQPVRLGQVAVPARVVAELERRARGGR